jgi:hypothetical protein
MNITPNDRQAIITTRAKFRQMMNGLTPQQQSDRARVIAGGIRRTDPLTRALAEQFVTFERIRDGIEAKQKELDQIELDVARGGHRPRDPDWKGRALTRKADLEKEINMDHAHALALREDPLSRAEAEFVDHSRAQQAAEVRNQRISEAVERKAAEADQADVDALADRIIAGRRIEQGKKNSGEAQ